MSRDGTRVVLERRPESPHDARALAAAIEFHGLLSARAIDARRIELRFGDATAAEAFCSDVSPVLDVGRFRVAEIDESRLRLARRGRSAIDRIEVLSMPADEQWRRLLARDIDVLPVADTIQRRHLAGISSIRVIDLPTVHPFGLFFDVRDERLTTAVQRHAIARALDRAAIARIACGTAECTSRMWEPLPVPAIVELPSRLSLLVLDSDYSAQLAAKTIRHQLHALGVRVEIETVQLEDLVRRIFGGGFELALLPMDPELMGNADMFRSASPRNPTGWSSPILDALIATGDRRALERLLAAELPALPLYEVTRFAAVDERFCGGDASPLSWRWLADLRPCEAPAP